MVRDYRFIFVCLITHCLSYHTEYTLAKTEISFLRATYVVVFIAILVYAQINIQIEIEDLRLKEGLRSRYIFLPHESWNSLFTGSFRGLVADLLWIKADEYNHRGQWYKLLPLFKMITFLQPKFITAWSVGGWHMAFNLYFHSQSPEEKEKWLKEGL